MRPSLVPGLVTSAQRNADRGFPDVGLFEVGQVFRGDKPEDQFTAATGLRRALAKPEGVGRHWDERQQAGRYLRRQGRCLRRAGGRRRADAGAAGGAGRPVLAASGAQRHHPDGAEERHRPFRRIASARAGRARRRGAAGRLRGDPREHPRAQGQADARQAAAGAVAVPAGRARLRLRGRPRASRPPTSCARRKASTRS